MNEKTLKALIDANAIKHINVIAQGDHFHVEVVTTGDSKVVTTGRGDIRLWRSIDACAKWIRKVGIGKAQLNLEKWQANQKALI
ncbi:MAG: hypothetical protein ACNA75_04005 [Thiohalomonadaceae bacterium]